MPFVNLLTGVILSQDFLNKDKNVNIYYEGLMPTLKLVALEAIENLLTVYLFEHMSVDCHPIATES